MAQRLSVSPMRPLEKLAGSRALRAVRGVWTADVGDGRNDLSGHADAAAVWFPAMWSVTSQKTGTSARTLQRVLRLGSYQTAWTWLHKLSAAAPPSIARPQLIVVT